MIMPLVTGQSVNLDYNIFTFFVRTQTWMLMPNPHLGNKLLIKRYLLNCIVVGHFKKIKDENKKYKQTMNKCLYFSFTAVIIRAMRNGYKILGKMEYS